MKTNDWLNEKMQSTVMIGIAVGLGLLAIVIEITILCCKSVGRKAPMNYILLFIFTACEAFLFSVICSFYSANVCLTAAGMTALVTVSLTIYACTTKTDFTIWGGLFFILPVVILGLCLVSWFLTFGAWWHHVVSGGFIVFYGLFLIYDT